MDTRPRKRQRRLILSSSDEEDNAILELKPEKSTGPSNWQSDKSRKFPASTAGSQKALPTRSRVRPSEFDEKDAKAEKRSRKKLAKEQEVSGAKDSNARPLSTFFNKKGVGSQQKPASQQEAKPGDGIAAAIASGPDDVDIDAIEDDSEAEQIQKVSKDCSAPKRFSGSKKEAGTQNKSAARLLGTKQSFRVTTDGTANTTTGSTKYSFRTGDHRPWAEKYGPTAMEELAVNKKKVMEVRTWIENVLSGKERKRLLILTGPSGSGKTVTVEMIARSMGLQLLEWRNPVGTDLLNEGYSSMSSQFTDFLGRSSSFGSLDFAGNTTDSLKGQECSQDATKASPRKIVLLDEFPSISTSALGALRSFRACLIEYLASHSPSSASERYNATESNDRIVPLILVITEIRSSSKVAAGESFTAHKLLGPEILGHVRVSTIDYNPIASTFLTKALELVLRKEARHSGRKRIPGPAVLKILGGAGDVRSATGSLEFLCARGKDDDEWSGRIAAKASRGPQAPKSLTKMEAASLSTVAAHRESSLGLFHAVGKVVYNKREDLETHGGSICCTIQPPHHLAQHGRARVSQLDPDGLIDQTGTDISTFVAALHENYVMSCEGSSFLDTMNGCLDAVSDTDIIASPRGARVIGSGSYHERGATESMRHEEISFHLAVRGLLFALPDPVRRATYPGRGSAQGGSKVDAYKMYYPTSLRLLNRTEETEDLIERWNAQSQMRSDHVSAANPWTQQGAQQLEKEAPLYRKTLNVTKLELVLERLPYMYKLEQFKPSLRNDFRLLESLTHFRGFNLPGSDPGDDDVADSAVQIEEGIIEHQAPVNSRDNPEQSCAHLDRGLEDLFLVEDDIEDD